MLPNAPHVVIGERIFSPRIYLTTNSRGCVNDNIGKVFPTRRQSALDARMPEIDHGDCRIQGQEPCAAFVGNGHA
mgnify:CR=1 FL=1